MALAALAGAGCVSAPFDLEALEARHPALARVEGHRLDRLQPYVWPRRGSLRWFTCRWDHSPVVLWAPPELAPRDRELLEQVASGVARAGLGLDFAWTSRRKEADVRFSVDPKPGEGSGRTAVDCDVRMQGDAVVASLLRAEVAIHRVQRGLRGKQIPLSEAEWAGTALHELGHALGFQGHLSTGRGPMVRNVEQVRAIGRKLVAGEVPELPSLRALYALPSGTLLRRDRLPAARTAALDRLGVLAARRGYRGPQVRVGDVAARIEWWRADGRVVSAWLPEIGRALRTPDALQIVPDPVADAWLAEAAP